MRHSAFNPSRRQRASSSEARAPFCASPNNNGDPFGEDSTPFSTFGAGAGSVSSPAPPSLARAHDTLKSTSVVNAANGNSEAASNAVPSLPGTPPAPAPLRSPVNGSPAATQTPSRMANLTKKFTSWIPQKGNGTGMASSPCSDTHHRSKSADAGFSSPERTGTVVMTTTFSSSGADATPAAPIRRRTTPPPVISVNPRGSSNVALGMWSPSTVTSGSVFNIEGEVHEPFLDLAPPAVPVKLKKTARPSAEEPAVGKSEAAPASPVTPTVPSPLSIPRAPAVVGNYARATTRLSGSGGSLQMLPLEPDVRSRSTSSSTPCWVSDHSASSSGSLEEEEEAPHQRKSKVAKEGESGGSHPGNPANGNTRHSHKSKKKRPPFFSAAPARGEFVALIEWLLRRGEKRDIGHITGRLSSGVKANSTSNSNEHGHKRARKQASFFNEAYISNLCAAATEVLRKEPAFLHLDVSTNDTLVLVGDIHGQFQDLYTSVLCQQYDRRHQCNPQGKDRRFLFMGDYVDRGPHSLEVVLLLLALKVEYPTLVYLTRGNHEEEKTSRVYGFLTEATSALGKEVGSAVWSAVNKVFLDLPLAASVQTPHMRFFVTHGGLSPVLHKTEEIAAVSRNRYSAGDITADQDDMVTGLLWSDPTNDVPMYKRNPRGCGFLFGPTASYNFCVENNFDFICRAHQVVMDGFVWTHNDRVVTVFSAPNYCGVNGNKGAVLLVNGHARRPILKQYESIESEEEAPGPPATFPYSALFS